MKNNDKQKNNKKAFSKSLLIQESVLIWITTICVLVMAFFCIFNGEFGDLPWLTAMIGFPWTAYAVSQMYYYKKSEKENTCGGITYESVMKEIEQMNNYKNNNYYDASVSEDNTEDGACG